MSEETSQTASARSRQHPGKRFAGDQHHFNLREVAQQLRTTDEPSSTGHRQITLYHRAPVTQVFFVFEAGGELSDHAANGLVTIHCIEGALEVEAEGQVTSLEPNAFVVLSPGVRHAVRAGAASAMLLTVHLERAGGESS